MCEFYIDRLWVAPTLSTTARYLWLHVLLEPFLSAKKALQTINLSKAWTLFEIVALRTMKSLFKILLIRVYNAQCVYQKALSCSILTLAAGSTLI